MKKTLIIILLLLPILTFAQKDKALRQGNDQYAEKKFSEAEAEYRISKSRYSSKATSAYNLGNSIYRQDQPSEAKSAFLSAAKSAKTRPQKHYAFHNLGNVYMKEKKYAEAVEAYKNALRNNPSDDETRYNFALAKKFLKENPPPKDDKKKDKKDDKKDKEKQDQKKDQKQKEKEGEDKKDQNKGQDKDKKDQNQGEKPQDQKPKPAPGGIPKQRLENMLDAVNNEEKKIQEKVNAKKVKARPVDNEKDW